LVGSSLTGEESRREVEEYIVSPNEICERETGQAIVVERGGL
jgi:hypothetical protein